MTAQQAEPLEFPHPFQVFDRSMISRQDLENMRAMAETYAAGYRDVADLERAERFDRALAEIRRRLESA